MLNKINNEIKIENNFNEAIDAEGFLINPSQWQPSYTERKAQLEGIELTDNHWIIINFIRDKYLRLGSLPPMRTVCKSSGLDKKELKETFGSCLNLWKLAGLPNPGDEAKTYMN